VTREPTQEAPTPAFEFGTEAARRRGQRKVKPGQGGSIRVSQRQGPAAQPVSQVEWVDPSTLSANDYNPNHVAPPELNLLAISILEDGWTQPLVARPDGEIVDGFHRWTIARRNPLVAALTDGLVPVVRIDPDRDSQRLSTIRHNRARGSHHVVKMADIVADLRKQGLHEDEIAERLQMEIEEVERLAMRGSMIERAAMTGFSEAWVPVRDADGYGGDPAAEREGR
jgi:hypothetical protein